MYYFASQQGATNFFSDPDWLYIWKRANKPLGYLVLHNFTVVPKDKTLRIESSFSQDIIVVKSPKNQAWQITRLAWEEALGVIQNKQLMQGPDGSESTEEIRMSVASDKEIPRREEEVAATSNAIFVDGDET